MLTRHPKLSSTGTLLLQLGEIESVLHFSDVFSFVQFDAGIDYIATGVLAGRRGV